VGPPRHGDQRRLLSRGLIRDLTDDLIASYRACLDGVAREREWLLLHEAPPLDACQAFQARLRDDGGVAVVAVENATVVGWCDVQRVPWAGCTHAGRLGIGLARSHRGRGLGRELLRAALARCDAGGITRIEAEVFTHNARSVRLLVAHGFQVEGLRRQVRCLEGQWDDALLLARLADPR
jgi:RimJ/RimL family protein N-acetyltransferase